MKLDSMSRNAVLFTSAVGNQFVVKSIQEARERLVEITSPAIFKFPSLSLGADDLDQFNAFAAEAKSKQVFLQYDEADFLMSKAERLQTVLSSLEAAPFIKKSE